jgi:putative transposase
MRPKTDQGHALNRMAGARRFVWNWALARWKEHHASTGRSISLKPLSAELTALKAQPGTAWLSDCDSQALQQVLADLHRAYANFFRKRSRIPRSKSRKRDKARFRIPQRVKIEDGRVYVPEVGWVRIRQSRQVDGQTKSATFRREADGHWYVSLTVEFEMPEVPLPMPTIEQTVGIDLGLIDFVTTSNPDPEGYGQELCLENSQAAGFSRMPSMKTVPLITSDSSGEPFNDRQLFDADSISL